MQQTGEIMFLRQACDAGGPFGVPSQVNLPSAGPGDMNYVAWQRLAMAGTPGPAGDLNSALELARKAVDKAPQNGGILNTLAALEAEHGDLDRAIPDNTRAMELRHIIEPTADDWIVIGRILEQLGLTADAAAAYKRVTPSPVDLLVSAHQLAQRRLECLDGGSRPLLLRSWLLARRGSRLQASRPSSRSATRPTT